MHCVKQSQIFQEIKQSVVFRDKFHCTELTVKVVTLQLNTLTTGKQGIRVNKSNIHVAPSDSQKSPKHSDFTS